MVQSVSAHMQSINTLLLRYNLLHLFLNEILFTAFVSTKNSSSPLKQWSREGFLWSYFTICAAVIDCIEGGGTLSKVGFEPTTPCTRGTCIGRKKKKLLCPGKKS